MDGSEGKFVQKLKIYAQKNCPVCGTAVAKVVNVACDETVLTDGKPDAEKIAPITREFERNCLCVRQIALGAAEENCAGSRRGFPDPLGWG